MFCKTIDEKFQENGYNAREAFVLYKYLPQQITTAINMLTSPYPVHSFKPHFK